MAQPDGGGGYQPYNTDTADLADFVREITDLAEHLGIKKRAAILHLARKFTDQKR